jgi:Na+/melibiose symporter-like transporter
VWTAGETLGLALGPALYAAVLALGGYVSSSVGSVTTVQDESTLTAIVLGFSVVPAVLVALSLLSLRRYSLPPPSPGSRWSADAGDGATPRLQDGEELS